MVDLQLADATGGGEEGEEESKMTPPMVALGLWEHREPQSPGSSLNKSKAPEVISTSGSRTRSGSRTHSGSRPPRRGSLDTLGIVQTCRAVGVGVCPAGTLPAGARL